MNILHVVHQYAPDHVGGTELYTQTLAAYQVAQGHRVAVFYPSPATADHSRPYPDRRRGVHVYGVPVGLRSRNRVFRDTFVEPGLVNAFTAVLQQECPDIVHIQHLMGLPYGLMAPLQHAAIPFVVTLHDYWYGCANGQLITNTDSTICAGPDNAFLNCGRCALARAGRTDNAWLAAAPAPLLAYRNRRLRQVLQAAHMVIAPTRFVFDTYGEMGLPQDNFCVIPHGIEVPQARIDVLLAQKASQPRPPGLRIGFVGSLGELKGVHVLITAMNQLPSDDVTLMIYGGLNTFPDYVASLQAAATHPGITFAGHISREALWPALAALDVVVMPTLWYEASPLTIQELFAVRVPIVASDIGAMSEKIRDGVDGLLFPPGDAAALANILEGLRQEPERLDHLRAGIGAVYTMREQVNDIADVYNAALAQTRND